MNLSESKSPQPVQPDRPTPAAELATAKARRPVPFSALPEAQGLYEPAREHDACGVAFVVDMYGRASHDIVARGLHALDCLGHRGASNAEPDTGDGAGIMIQIPDAFYRREIAGLPPLGHYATGLVFLPQDPTEADRIRLLVAQLAAEEDLQIVAWRTVPVDPSGLGQQALSVMPSIDQLVLGCRIGRSGIELDRAAYVLRKRLDRSVAQEQPIPSAPDAGRDQARWDRGSEDHAAPPIEIYIPSLSTTVITYKGMLTTPQLSTFFADLRDPLVHSAMALVHSRFSTNTFPSWPLAHPYRYVAHNGEINTLRGNRNRMRAREAMLRSPVWGDRIADLLPICTPDHSDTASFDETLELLYLSGYELAHAVLMMIPEAWQHHADMASSVKDFYRFNGTVMEAWDGPAAMCFTDGTTIGAVLDRNGLRPARYWVSDEGLVVLASEVGVADMAPERIVAKGRLEPGRLFLVDTSRGEIVDDDAYKQRLAEAKPYGAWLAHIIALEDLPRPEPESHDPDTLHHELLVHGFTEEELDHLVLPMARDGVEALGSMGTDTPIAVLSERPRLLFDYFSQLFAQVTNPPLDAIREALVTSAARTIGPEGNLLDPGADSCHRLELASPLLSAAELGAIMGAGDQRYGPVEHPDRLTSRAIDGRYVIADGVAGLRARLEQMCNEVDAAIADGVTMVLLTNRGADRDHAPIPSLLMTGAVHQHLLRNRTRLRIGLLVDAADAREVHHFALLLGFGAGAICPSVSFDAIDERLGLHPQLHPAERARAHHNYIKAATKGIIKVMSKMGISTVGSYASAQIFEAVGLSDELIDTCFTGTPSRLGGIGFEELAEECRRRHQRAFPARAEQLSHRRLEFGGEYQWRREGEYHLFNPETVFRLQHATRSRRYEIFKQYTAAVDEQAERLATLRGLFKLRPAAEPIDIDEVESVASIVKRFATGAMSYGSISAEAHETLAIAMNRLGAKSNTGEGGEDPERYVPSDSGDSKRSAIKQVASGRFGVTAHYLSNADDLQIKMAQGAKPGEGGQLPGEKVYPWIAKTRHSTPGVGLISPPPHHDIYSIEDLAQLIHDLKNANPAARIHVKLVAENGVGTVAAGVSKAKADVVLISGHDGGTGASPLTSIKHAGAPWELGLAETQQTLLLNDLRDRIVVQVDGQLKTGRDVIIAALLGAEEFGFATAPLVVSGCVMMRVCHLDTCPVGVATQDPELRKRFTGTPEFVETFFEYIATEVREYLAQLGFRSLSEAIGRAECIEVDDAIRHWKADGLDLSPILYVPQLAPGAHRYQVQTQDHGLAGALDHELIRRSQPALALGEPVRMSLPISNRNRTVGTMLGHEVTKIFGGEGLPDDTIEIDLHGSAGNSLGAFIPRGITLRVTGDANDYVGKGLSGGRIVLRPPRDARFRAEESVIAGNVILFGATSGEIYLRGLVGERFCVRNSGATAVVEGVGDHGCEYMTGGRVVILGPVGRNFAAGMSGGIAYVYDPNRMLRRRLNPESVELEALSESDRSLLRHLIATHECETGSAVAARILADWEHEIIAFTKVMPVEYRRVLEAQAADPGLNLRSSLVHDDRPDGVNHADPTRGAQPAPIRDADIDIHDDGAQPRPTSSPSSSPAHSALEASRG